MGHHRRAEIVQTATGVRGCGKTGDKVYDFRHTRARARTHTHTHTDARTHTHGRTHTHIRVYIIYGRPNVLWFYDVTVTNS